MTDLEIRQFFLPQAVILLLAKGRPTPLISTFEGPFTHAIFDATFAALFNAIFIALKLHHYIARAN